MAKIHRSDDAFAVQRQKTAALPKQAPDAGTQPPPAAGAPDTAALAPRKKGKPKKAKRRGNLAYDLAILVCLAVFLVCGGLLVKRYFDDRRTESEFADLQALIEPQAETPAADGEASNSARFAALRERNGDFIGWISIDDTPLDFPVMFAPDNKDFYLRHDFYQEYSIYGVPYLDEKTTMGANAQSDNLVIYGHNMKTGTIFGCLTNYKEASYYSEHPRIDFDTIYGDATYEVFAAFSIDVATDTSFVYNQYIDLDEDGYNAYVDEVIRRSDVDSGIRPVYGEQLLTLSTCEYSSENGRYVVVARRVSA